VYGILNASAQVDSKGSVVKYTIPDQMDAGQLVSALEYNVSFQVCHIIRTVLLAKLFIALCRSLSQYLHRFSSSASALLGRSVSVTDETVTASMDMAGRPDRGGAKSASSSSADHVRR
jgi:hypothetical protein